MLGKLHVDVGADILSLVDDAMFTGLGLGALNANAFFAGTAAHDADDRIIYNKTTGQLFYDDDGTGAHAQVWFAVLTTKPVDVAANDFAVI